jgi:hypothetical protein
MVIIMDNEVTKYDVLIEAITNYTNELDEVNNKIEKIKLNKDEEKEFNTIINKYDEKEPMSIYLEKQLNELNKKTNLYKYLQLYKKGITINEELTTVMEAVANTES